MKKQPKTKKLMFAHNITPRVQQLVVCYVTFKFILSEQ